MRLYIDAITNCKDLVIDYIEVKLKNGSEVSLNWDESEIERTKTGFSARYKGIYFGEEYANGRLSELKGLQIDTVGVYSEIDEKPSLEFTGMEFVDNEFDAIRINNLTIKNIEHT